MNIVGTVIDFLKLLLYFGVGFVVLVVLVYLLVRIGTVAFFQAKFQVYRNRNKNKNE